MTPSALPAPAAPDDRIGATAVVATTAALVSLVLTSIVLSPSASANRPDPTVRPEPVGMVRHGGSGPSAAEVPAVDAGTERASVLDAQATSVAVHDRLVDVAERAHPVPAPGSVVFVDAEDLARVGQVVPVGALPDMVSVTPG